MELREVSAVIANTASVSQAIGVPASGFRTMSIWMPAAWTAAALTFEASIAAAPASDADWSSVRIEGTELNLTTGADFVHVLMPPKSMPPGAKWIRLVSGVKGTRVAQGAERTIQLKLLTD